MAVTSVTPHHTGGSGAGSGTGSATAKVSFRTVHFVQCDDPEDTSLTVFLHFRSTSSLPWFGRRFQFGNDTDNSTFCRTLNINRIPNSGGMFMAEATYEPAEGGGSGSPGSISGTRPDGRETTNPLQWRDEIETSYTQITVPVWQATYRGSTPNVAGGLLTPGKLTCVKNSAGKAFNPPPEAELDVKVLRFTKYVNTFVNFDPFIGVVNREHVVIDKPTYRFHQEFSPQVGKIKGVNQHFFINDGIKCWKQTVEIHLNPNGWRGIILDQGLEELIRPGDRDDDGNILSPSDFPERKLYDYRHFKDEEGYPSVDAQRLDGKGRKLAPDKDDVWLNYQYYEERAFGFLNGVAW